MTLLINRDIVFDAVKQLLDKVEHDIMNYQNRGLCYRLRLITQTRGFENS